MRPLPIITKTKTKLFFAFLLQASVYLVYNSSVKYLAEERKLNKWLKS